VPSEDASYNIYKKYRQYWLRTGLLEGAYVRFRTLFGSHRESLFADTLATIWLGPCGIGARRTRVKHWPA
jgi:hypothetical protein